MQTVKIWTVKHSHIGFFGYPVDYWPKCWTVTERSRLPIWSNKLINGDRRHSWSWTSTFHIPSSIIFIKMPVAVGGSSLGQWRGEFTRNKKSKSFIFSSLRLEDKVANIDVRFSSNSINSFIIKNARYDEINEKCTIYTHYIYTTP